jgi:hypothetical protein
MPFPETLVLSPIPKKMAGISERNKQNTSSTTTPLTSEDKQEIYSQDLVSYIPTVQRDSVKMKELILYSPEYLGSLKVPVKVLIVSLHVLI